MLKVTLYNAVALLYLTLLFSQFLEFGYHALKLFDVYLPVV